MILSGTIASTVQLQMLNNKWMQKKESGNVLSKQELNERSTWTSEQFMIADFQDQLEHNRETQKRQKIDNKIMSGGSLSPEEISYLEKNDPVALKKYRETKEDKESYKEKLRQCKTKEEVDRVKLQKLGELESSLSSVVNDPTIPKSAKLAKAQEILAKTNNIEAAHLEFVKSADYQSMPTDDEKKEQDAADNDISDEITDSYVLAEVGSDSAPEEKRDKGEEAEIDDDETPLAGQQVQSRRCDFHRGILLAALVVSLLFIFDGFRRKRKIRKLKEELEIRKGE